MQQASLSPLDRRGHLRQDREAACDPVPGQAAPLLPATLGCHMAHCDARMSDNAGLQGPLHPRPQIVVHDGAAPGALPGLGCSSNGEVVACALAPLDGRDALIAYDGDGRRLGSSGSHLGFMTCTSAATSPRRSTRWPATGPAAPSSRSLAGLTASTSPARLDRSQHHGADGFCIRADTPAEADAAAGLEQRVEAGFEQLGNRIDNLLPGTVR